MRIRAHEVAAYVAELHGIPFQGFYGRQRTRRIARPRQIAMYCIRHLCPHMSYPRIAMMMGDRDHTTILHGFRKIEELIDTDVDVSDAVDRVMFHFTGSTVGVRNVMDSAVMFQSLCGRYGQAMKAAA